MKIAQYTDIHFGKKSNSQKHNEDCLAFIGWFLSKCEEHGVDAISFDGDYFENRSSIDSKTLQMAYRGVELINATGIPTYHLIGNHDLYHRNTREVFVPYVFNHLRNIKIISEITSIKMGGDDILLCPYLFHHEYAGLKKYMGYNAWIGHFEFKGFVVTGTNNRMKTGPDSDEFQGGPIIFSGHFHKRQESGRVVYIGNTFGMDFNDANDSHRGMCIYDTETRSYQFIDWEEGPKYQYMTITEYTNDPDKVPPNTQVEFIIDQALSFEDVENLRLELEGNPNISNFTLVESPDIYRAITDTSTVIDSSKVSSLDDMVLELLKNLSVKNIQNDILMDQYRYPANPEKWEIFRNQQ